MPDRQPREHEEESRGEMARLNGNLRIGLQNLSRQAYHPQLAIYQQGGHHMVQRRRYRLLIGVLVLAGAGSSFQPISAQDLKFFAYNNTTRTDFTGLYMAPAGTESWGPNQALNDKDKILDAGERLTLIGLSPGTFSVKLVDRSSRTCILQDVDLTKEKSFDIRDGQLSNCH
jgi:hypothetical protein